VDHDRFCGATYGPAARSAIVLVRLKPDATHKKEAAWGRPLRTRSG